MIDLTIKERNEIENYIIKIGYNPYHDKYIRTVSEEMLFEIDLDDMTFGIHKSEGNILLPLPRKISAILDLQNQLLRYSRFPHNSFMNLGMELKPQSTNKEYPTYIYGYEEYTLNFHTNSYGGELEVYKKTNKGEIKVAGVNGNFSDMSDLMKFINKYDGINNLMKSVKEDNYEKL